MLTIEKVKKYDEQMKNGFKFRRGCYSDEKKAEVWIPLDPEEKETLQACLYWQEGGYNWRTGNKDPHRLMLHVQKMTASGAMYVSHGLGKFFPLKETAGRMMFSDVIKATADFTPERIKSIYLANKLDLDDVYRKNGGASGIFEELARPAVMVEG